MFIEDEQEALFAGRQYPFFSPTALDVTKQACFELLGAHNYCWSNWYNDYICNFPRENANAPSEDTHLRNGRHIMMNGRIYPMLELVTDDKSQLHYNDLLYSSTYVPYYCWSYYPKSTKRKLHFSIGGPAPCVCCGSTQIELEASMLCYDCGADWNDANREYYTYCACCDRRIAREHSIWVEGIGDDLCQDCFGSETTVCERCGERYYNCEVTYNREKDMYECTYCREKMLEKEILF